MTSFTYSTLKAKLQAYTEDSGSDFLDNLDVIIQNGQEKIVRDLNLEIFKNTVPKNMTNGANFMDKDASILAGDEVWYLNSAGKWRLLRKRDYGFCQAYWPNLSNTGEPRYYSDLTDTQIFVVPTPNSAYQTKTRGIVRPRPLSDNDPQNWLSINVGDLLLYSCLMESEGFLMSLNSGRIQNWRDEYAGRLPTAREELKDLERIPYEPINRNAEVSKV